MSRLLCCALILPSLQVLAEETPVARDERLVVELFAEHPQIVTPTGLAVDGMGRVFVGESHTHFRPDGYDGPEADRILAFEDTDGDGRADKRTVFHEGFRHVMDIEFDHGGALWVATRRDIHRMRDTDGNLFADEVKRMVELDTPGTYPHNGLSGLAFDFLGGLHFGLGENLGAEYTLIGPDGTKLSGGAEGGSTYYLPSSDLRWPRTAPEPRGPLRRTSTGWWNPYGMCVDSYGRVFGTDNDPDSSPPCRLIQVVEGGDYGYEFRYGRSGRHPLVCWNGEIPGTLPMISGTGEAPCAIVSYDSDALPEEYRGNLLVPCWGDHRIEHYKITQSAQRGLVDAERNTLVEGPDDFRPVGIDVAPDGTVYVSDWVSSSYSLHKLGRIWRIRPRAFEAPTRSADPRQSIKSLDRRTRVKAWGRIIDRSSSFLDDLIDGHLRSEKPEIRAAALQTMALFPPIGLRDRQVHRYNEKHIPNRLLALQVPDWRGPRWQRRSTKTVAEHAASVSADFGLAGALKSDDPLLFASGVGALASTVGPADAALANSDVGLAVLLAAKHSDAKERFEREYLDLFLAAKDSRVRFSAVKWIADERLSDYRDDLVALLDDPALDYRLFLATVAALDRLDGKKPADRPAAEFLVAKIADGSAPTAIRRLALRMVDAASPQLKLPQLVAATREDDEGVQIEAMRTLARHPDAGRIQHLLGISHDDGRSDAVRAEAVLGLAGNAAEHAEQLWSLRDAGSAVAGEVARALIGIERAYADDADIEVALQKTPEAAARLLGKAFERPAASEIDAWLKLLDDSGDAATGQRIFFGAKVGTCAKCHTIDGRGNSIGPDLTSIRKRVASMGLDGKRWLLETILQPSQDMAPHFTPWQIVTTDGKTLVGLPLRKGSNRETYLGIDGQEFSINKDEIDFRREADKSIMPEGLLQQLTRQELNDLFAFILAR